MTWLPRTLLALVAVALLAACSGSGGAKVAVDPTTVPSSTTTSTSTTTAPEPTTAPTTAPPATDAPAPAAAPAVAATDGSGRSVTEQPWVPFATVGGVTLTHPSHRVEHIGYHQANHDGAQDQEPLPTAVNPSVLPDRGRGTGRQTAADIVVEPGTEIRSPVTGRVIAANTYDLYCSYTDELVFIEPDAHPGWEVRVLHVVGLQVAVGQRVVAGETVIAEHAHQLPFGSQVDDIATAQPPWPHVHVEVVDPSIPDIPNPGPGGSGC